MWESFHNRLPLEGRLGFYPPGLKAGRSMSSWQDPQQRPESYLQIRAEPVGVPSAERRFLACVSASGGARRAGGRAAPF